MPHLLFLRGVKLGVKKNHLNCIVVKFGGSSLSDGPSISRAVNSVVDEAKKGVQIAVVVSAMGRTTDLLIETAKEACGGDISAAELDDILAMGERTSAKIFTAALRARGQESRCLDPSDPDWPIITDESFTNSKPLIPICEDKIKRRVQPLLEKGMIAVIPGFIGKTKDGATTTIGRGGSDITALILASGLSADQVIMVTDVDGIMTADPKIIKKPEILKEVSIDTLIGLADSGTKFIQKKALRYKNPSIDIKVINNALGDLSSEGTIISGNFPSEMVVEPYPKPAMSITIVGRAVSDSPETIMNILQQMKEAGIPLLGMSINYNSLILYLPMDTPADLLEFLHSVIVKDDRAFAMAVRRDLAFVKVKGVGLEETPGIVSRIADALKSSEINIYGIFTITSSVLIFVDLKDKEKTIRLIGEAIKANSN